MLWSRLGPHDPLFLEDLLAKRRELFERCWRIDDTPAGPRVHPRDQRAGP
ncbi:MAG: hypothetical protein ACRDGT_05350 [Candidatus Limnocylindria bacterium]